MHDPNHETAPEAPASSAPFTEDKFVSEVSPTSTPPPAFDTTAPPATVPVDQLAPLREVKLLFLDTETTGFRPRTGDRVVEVAVVTCRGRLIIEQWSALVDPQREVPAEATAVHGITTAQARLGLGSEVAYGRVHARSLDHAIVIHNAAFDLPFLSAMSPNGLPIMGPVIDTLGLARGLFGMGGNSIETLTARFGLPPQKAHRALGDVLMTVEIFWRLAGLWAARGINTVETLSKKSHEIMVDSRTRFSR